VGRGQQADRGARDSRQRGREAKGRGQRTAGREGSERQETAERQRAEGRAEEVVEAGCGEAGRWFGRRTGQEGVVLREGQRGDAAAVLRPVSSASIF
jgi:hypothetical protein